MAETLDAQTVEHLVTAGGAALAQNAFAVLRALSGMASANGEDPSTTELVLRAMEHRDDFGAGAHVLDALLRKQGLFPYLEGSEGLSDRDALAVEFHRPANLDDVVFHRVQARVYDKLIARESVVLSAPTSFGKSLLIDAVIASGIYKNVVIVVPTLALIDETRRRLTARFSAGWKIITHHSQQRRERNVYLLTAERIAEFEDFPQMDFFVVDEFYKLSPTRHDERCTTLNQALYKLLKRGTPFYLLGPSIQDVPQGLKDAHHCTFIHTDYKTVASHFTRIDPGKDELAALTSLARHLDEPTIVFCKSPLRVRQVARALLDAGIRWEVPEHIEPAASWMARYFHPEWTLVQALRAGIGIHHGKLPRWLGQYQVRLFNDDAVRFLVCTSTLIEGVNTKAKNVVIFDKQISRKNFDFFTFNNIRGRAGRMFQHYVGNVYLFHDPPQEELPVIDIPAVTLDESAPDALLLQADPNDVTPGARKRLDGYFSQQVLDVAVLRENADVDPEQQLEFARTLRAYARHYWPLMNWTAFPTSAQLYNLCELIWQYFVGHQAGGIRTGRQLAFKLGQLRETTDIRMLIHGEEENTKFVHSADEAVDNVLEFLRYWASYSFSRYAIAVDNIQKSVFSRAGLTPGDYRVYAAQVQHLFSDPACVIAEEYGIPFQLAKRLEGRIAGGGDLDVTLEKLKNLRVQLVDPFERELLAEAQRNM